MICESCPWRKSNVCKQCPENPNNTAVPAPDLERATGNAPMEKKKGKRLDPRISKDRVRIHVHSRRIRLCDADGASAKAVIDGLVLAGILRNDSPEEVESVSYSQEQCDKEETEVCIYAVD